MPSITFTLPVAGTDVEAGPIATNFSELQTLLNGGLDVTNMAAGNKVTYGVTPPTSPTNGDIWYLQTHPSDWAGVIWQFRYNSTSASAYKWEFVGGPPLVVANGNLTGMSFAAASVWEVLGPSIVAPRAGEYMLSATVSIMRSSNGGLNVYFGSAARTDVLMRTTADTSLVISGAFTAPTPAVAASGNIRVYGYAETSTAGLNVWIPTISAFPIRVS